MNKKKISIIIPVFNESKNIELIYNRILKTLKNEPNYDFEILFTNNASTDDTLSKIEDIIKQDNRIKVITLSKNFGRNISIFAGLNNVDGNLIFLIDADCEDPPELLSSFLRKHEEGFDLVYGIRNRINESFLLYIGAKIFYRFTNLFADNEIILDMGEFVLFTREINNEIIKIKSDKPFIRSELSAVGFNKFGINYKRSKRKFEKTKYSLFKLINYGLAGFLSSSTFFLRFNAAFSSILILFNILFLIFHFRYDYFEINSFLFVNVLYLIFLSIFLSIYLARTHNNVLGRSIYIVNQKKCFNITNIK